MGRPSDFTQEIADAICERLAEGESLRSICRDDGMPNKATVFRWLTIHESFRDQYACARESQGEADADRVGDVTQKVLDGELDPAAARVAIDALKWSAGKRLPKKYGDLSKVELSGPDGAPIQTENKVDLSTFSHDERAVLRLLAEKAKGEK